MWFSYSYIPHGFPLLQAAFPVSVVTFLLLLFFSECTSSNSTLNCLLLFGGIVLFLTGFTVYYQSLRFTARDTLFC